MARGNIAGAVFNATLSSLIGMVLTPLYVGLYMTAEHHGVPLVEQFIKIGEQLLLPFIIGQCLRHWIGDWIMRNKSRVGLVDRTVIVMIVFNSRSEEHTSELQSLMRISYAVFCLKK